MTLPTAPIPLMPDAAGATPVMAQFFEAKARQPDALVFFRMGDVYELFFEDAHRAAAAIGIALTHRGTHAGQPIPMAGVPAHAAEAYLAKLIRAGFKVAVCEQMEDPAEARKRGGKGIVRRDLVRVVTPEPRQCFLPICPASRPQRVSYPQLQIGSPRHRQAWLRDGSHTSVRATRSESIMNICGCKDRVEQSTALSAGDKMHRQALKSARS